MASECVGTATPHVACRIASDVSVRSMGKITIGPNARSTLQHLSLNWRQGEHFLVTGGTGSGKTLIARYLDQIRLDKGGSVVVFVGKLQADSTLSEHYKGWTRWKRWRKPGPRDRKILLWPDVENKPFDEASALMREVFLEALREISKVGKWTVHLDEGLLMVDSRQLNLGTQIAMMSSLIRSAEGTLIVLAQRPSHLPLVLYSNLSYALIAYARERSDLERLSNLDGKVSRREMESILQSNKRYDFTFIDAVGNRPPTRFNLTR